MKVPLGPYNLIEGVANHRLQAKSGSLTNVKRDISLNIATLIC